MENSASSSRTTSNSPAQPAKLTRAEAARRNGARSRGPVTPEGKARSACNRRTHGLNSSHFLQTPEDAKAFRRYHQMVAEHWCPQSEVGHALVYKLARAFFLHDRTEELQCALLAGEQQRTDPSPRVAARLALAFRTIDDRSSDFRVLDRHLIRLSREIDRLTTMLAYLQQHQASARLSAKHDSSIRTQAAAASATAATPSAAPVTPPTTKHDSSIRTQAAAASATAATPSAAQPPRQQPKVNFPFEPKPRPRPPTALQSRPNEVIATNGLPSCR